MLNTHPTRSRWELYQAPPEFDEDAIREEEAMREAEEERERHRRSLLKCFRRNR